MYIVPINVVRPVHEHLAHAVKVKSAFRSLCDIAEPALHFYGWLGVRDGWIVAEFWTDSPPSSDAVREQIAYLRGVAYACTQLVSA